MTIETKFNIHDKVWFVNPHGKAEECLIQGVRYRTGNQPTSSVEMQDYTHPCVEYCLCWMRYPASEMGDYVFAEEGRVFATKEELIASL